MKKILFIHDRSHEGRFVPNGLAPRGPMWTRFTKGEGEFRTEYCGTPLVTLLAAEKVPFRECSFQDFKRMSRTERDAHHAIYLVEMLYSYRVWLPLKNGESFPLHPFSQVPTEAVDAINRGEMKLVITHFKRPERNGTPWNLFSRLLSRIKDAQIDPKKAVFLGCTENFVEDFEKEKSSNPDLEQYGQVAYLPYFERGWHSYLRHYRHQGQTYTLSELESDLAPNNLDFRKKSFLAFNREPRAHRRVLAGFLERTGLLEQTMISFPKPEDPFLITKFDEYGEGLHHIFKSPEMLRFGNSDFMKFAEHAPYTVDFEDLLGLHISWCTKAPFRETTLCVLTERLFHSPNDHVLFTSKIFKSIANSHPFVVIGAQRSLERLRKHGYQTFSGLLDESYDLMSDPDERMAAIFKILSNFAKLSRSEQLEWTREALPILRHNHERLNQRQSLPLTDYLAPCFS